MVASCFNFSFISLYGHYLRRQFIAAGLSQQRANIDDETTIHFWGPKPGINLPPKPSLVLLHGFGPIALWQWRQQVCFLSPHFNIYVPNLLFFGGSTTKSSERTEVFQAVSVGKLMEILGVERFSVMGTSYGGFVAYHMAAMWPERVDKVVIASSAVNMVRRDNKELMERAKVERIEDLMLPTTAGQLRTLLVLAAFKTPKVMPDFLLNDFLDKLYFENREEKIELLKGLTIGRDDTPNISPLQQEVLLVWGDHDNIFPLKKATELKELLGEKARLEVMKNTSHVPQIEQPEQFNEIVKDFLCASS
ncbi:hypothetical protein L1049_019129 [Liquidambar formosana]|uniref:AB hydrolase-1 domain-containing protein n=1 Tax=Liquidambar formosana TaxID=63359 RepID=A0AAP0WPN8_LIQFO